MRTYLAVILLLMMGGLAFADQPDSGEGVVKGPLRAAIFVQNRAGNEFQDKLDAFKDLISARLSEKGFSVIDKNDVLAKFQESRHEDGSVIVAIKVAVDLTKSLKTEASVEDVVTDASALRIAQTLGANYLIFATITSFGQEQKVFKGQGTVYGTDNAVTDNIMRLTLKVCEGTHGSTIYGDTVTTTELVPQSKNLEINSSDTINKLFDTGAGLVADNVSRKIEDIRAVKVEKGSEVEFEVASNVQGASVELDGAAIGAAPGHFRALEGVHQLRLSKERYTTWEKTVNIHSGQKLNVSLELSQEGIQRLDGTSDIENKKKLVDGEKAMLDQSYVHDDGIGHEIKEVIHAGVK